MLGPVATLSFPPGRRLKSIALPTLAVLRSMPSEPVSVKPLIPSSVATPVAWRAVYVRGVPVVTISVISARPTFTLLSWIPTSPVATGCPLVRSMRPPRPAKTPALPRPIWSSDTRTVEVEPVGVTSSSAPFSKEKLPAAYTKPATSMLAVPATRRRCVVDVKVTVVTPSLAVTGALKAPV